MSTVEMCASICMILSQTDSKGSEDTPATAVASLLAMGITAVQCRQVWLHCEAPLCLIAAVTLTLGCDSIKCAVLHLSGLGQGSAKFFGKWPERKYFSLCSPDGPHHNNPTLPWESKSHHKQYIICWAWPCPSKISFT